MAQRLGWLLEHDGAGEVAVPLAQSLGPGPLFPTPLRTDIATAGLAPDPRWGVIANTTIEDDA